MIRYLQISQGYGKRRRSVGLLGAYILPAAFDCQGIPETNTASELSELYNENGSFSSFISAAEQLPTGSNGGGNNNGGSSTTTTSTTTSTTTKKRDDDDDDDDNGNSGGNNGNGETDGQNGNGNSNGNGTNGGGSNGNSGRNKKGPKDQDNSESSGNGNGELGKKEGKIESSQRKREIPTLNKVLPSSKESVTNTLKSLLTVMGI